MLTVLLLVSSILSADPELLNAMPLHAPGGWHVDVGPGMITVSGREIAMADPVRLEVPPPEAVSIVGEEHVLPLFDPNAGGWRKGARLKTLIAQECSATGLLKPETVVVKRASDGEVLTLDKDYALDGLWATVGRLEGGGIGEREAVRIDYTYGQARLDVILINSEGQVRLELGTPGLGFDLPGEPFVPETHIGSVWNPGNITEITDENLLPVEQVAASFFPPAPWYSKRSQQNAAQVATEATPPEYYPAEQFLPKTLAKLEAGEKVTIVAWGDSVTAGGGVGSAKELWYQYQFLDRLKKRYPKADIEMITAAWPGRGSRDYLEAPAGGDYDFQRDVLDPKPDLVTCEWVNDAYLKDEALVEHYTLILEKLRGAGAEVALLTPHLVRPDWMGVDTIKFDEDPRPYVQGLRKFAEANDVALADGARLWCGLWRKGIPYTTLLANYINHPDERGQRLLAMALMELFPE